MDCSFLLTVFFDSQKNAEIVFQAVFPELNQKHERRSSTLLKTDKEKLSLKITALDEKSLKASVNSYLKLLDLSIQTLEVS